MIATLLAIIYLYLLGYAFLIFIRFRDDFALNLSLAGLAGMGITTILMFLLDVLGFSVSSVNLILAGILFLLLFLAQDALKKNVRHWQEYFRFRVDWKNLNSIEVTILLVIVLLILASFIKNIYWPVQSYDSLAGYDLMARVISAEKTFNVSLHRFGLAGPRGIYPPQVEGIFAFFYLMGAPSAKVVNSLFFISLLLLFYRVCKKYLTGLGAAVFTLFLTITPELYAHASLSLTNLPAAAYVTGGLLFLYLWWKEGKTAQLILSGLFFGLNTWTRSDGVVFSLAAAIVLFILVLKNRQFLSWIYHSLLAFLPFLIWQVYLKIVIHAESAERFRHELFWDPRLLTFILKYIKMLFFNVNLYGLVFYIFVAVFLINIKFLKQNWPVLAYLLLGFVFYTFIYYQLNPETQDSIQTMMRASYKRAVFYYIPGVLFYSAVSLLSIRFFNRLEEMYQKFVYGRS